MSHILSLSALLRLTSLTINLLDALWVLTKRQLCAGINIPEGLDPQSGSHRLSLPFQKFPVGFGAVEVKKPRGWGVEWDQKGLLETQGFHLCFPSQGTTVSLSETVQKWREYRRQCQRFLTEAPLLATGESLNTSKEALKVPSP